MSYREGSPQRAVENLKKAISSDPRQTMHYVKTSHLFATIMVTQLIRTGVAVDQLYLDSRRNIFVLLAVSYFKSGDFDQMLQISRYAAKIDSRQENTFACYEGIALYGLKQYGRSFALLKDCARRDPTAVEAYEYMGLALKAEGRNEQADKLREISDKLKEKSHRSLFDVRDIDLVIY